MHCNLTVLRNLLAEMPVSHSGLTGARNWKQLGHRAKTLAKAGSRLCAEITSVWIIHRAIPGMDRGPGLGTADRSTARPAHEETLGRCRLLTTHEAWIIGLCAAGDPVPPMLRSDWKKNRMTSSVSLESETSWVSFESTATRL
jgi:hypothetical protein